MIDGITSRPFSAKTLPPMAHGNPEVVEGVIKSSRELYCRSKEVVEREINNWSGMSLGNDNDVSNGVEKFRAQCTLCKKETFVPFKPEPGRSVYCRECIAKLKSGELKPVKGSINQIKYDEAKFYKPLSDLGIEFESKTTPPSSSNKEERYPERVDMGGHLHDGPTKAKPKILATLKKVFNKPGQIPSKNNFTKNKILPTHPARGENLALKEILNKTLSENKVFQEEKKEPVIEEIKKNVPEPISLNTLKTPIAPVSVSLKDKAAKAEEMNKLKDLIKSKPEIKEKPIENVLVENIVEPPTQQKEPDIAQVPPVIPEPEVPKSDVREVPEDILRKILE